MECSCTGMAMHQDEMATVRLPGGKFWADQ
jgi:hypothetical protein